jgi:hypothetical protein
MGAGIDPTWHARLLIPFKEWDMERFTQSELTHLLHNSSAPAISIYLSTHPDGKERKQDPIGFKVLLGQAIQQLSAWGVNERGATQMLQSASAHLGTNQFWLEQSRTLVYFVTTDSSQFFRLPVELEQQIVVGSHFYTLPLISFCSSELPFYLLALSKNSVALYGGNRYGMQQIELPDVPHSFDDALQLDRPAQLREFHPRQSGPSTTTGEHPALFHGQDLWAGRQNRYLEHYVAAVNTGLQKYLTGVHTPLIFAGVKELFDVYRHTNSYPFLAQNIVEGNVERLAHKQLFERAREAAGIVFQQANAQMIQRLAQWIEEGNQRSSSDCAAIIQAAYQGRVSHLMVGQNAHQWGHFDVQNNTTTLLAHYQPGAEELLNSAARQTLLSGGEVVVVERNKIPGEKTIAALFRY